MMAREAGYLAGSQVAWRNATYDPRGAFNRDSRLAEADWVTYRDAYQRGYESARKLRLV